MNNLQTFRFMNTRHAIFTFSAILALLTPALLSAETAGGDVLDLHQTIVLALKNNYRVEDGRLAAEQADKAVTREQGVFDPKLTVTSGDFRQQYNNGMLPAGAGVQSSAGLSGALPTGTSYNVTLYTTELKNVPDADRQTTGGYVEVRQNLMKGFGWNANVAPIRIAAKNAAISRLAFERDVTNLITEVNFAYFDLILAGENARVARGSYDLAEKLCQENKQRLALKSIAESDLYQAQAELAARRDNLLEAERLLGDARNNLRVLIADDPQKAVKMSLAAAPLETPKKVDVDSANDYRHALALRQDYRQAVLGLDRDRIDALRASNAALPQVEAFAQGYWNGTDDDFKHSYDRAKDDGRPDYYAGVSMKFDLPNRTGWAERSIARKQVRRAELTLKDLERRIAVEVDDGARKIECDWNRIVAAREGRELAEKSLKAEQQRYDIGLSSTFVLLRLQTDLMNAQIRELMAENDYRKSVVDYQRIIGITLADNNVILPK
jgi:outer membrane protein TolC